MLLEAHWLVSLALGLSLLVVVTRVMPALASDRPIIKPLVGALQGFAWIVATILFVISAIALVRQLIRQKAATSQDNGNRQLDRSKMHRASREPVDHLDRAREPSIHGNPDRMPPVPPQAVSPGRWSLDLIRDLEWKRFEDVCQRYYTLKGIRSDTTPLGPDGGIDIRLYQDGNSPVVTTVVQCKAWGDRAVGVKPVRELLGVQVHEKVEKAFFMTSGGYTDEARIFARSNRITLIDGEMLIMMFCRLPDDVSQSLLAFATAGDYRTPTCPSCGTKMIYRPGRDGKPDFWGCADYPRCRQNMRVRKGHLRHT